MPIFCSFLFILPWFSKCRWTDLWKSAECQVGLLAPASLRFSKCVRFLVDRHHCNLEMLINEFTFNKSLNVREHFEMISFNMQRISELSNFAPILSNRRSKHMSIILCKQFYSFRSSKTPNCSHARCPATWNTTYQKGMIKKVTCGWQKLITDVYFGQ